MGRGGFVADRRRIVKQRFEGWTKVARELEAIAQKSRENGWLDDGQRASLARIVDHIADNGILIADEVGMGKTRIAAALASAVVRAGGRVAILVPPALPYQWKDELIGARSALEDTKAALEETGLANVPMLRSLRQYMRAWTATESEQARPWFEQDAVVISHAFANYRFSKKKEPWRWALLPELYAEWRARLSSRRRPRGYTDESTDRIEQQKIAETIAKAISADSSDPLLRERADALFGALDWTSIRDRDSYGDIPELKAAMDKAIGLGFGTFDLIILDEAHKSRGQNSVLNALIEHVVIKSGNARCLALSATPVELSVDDWKTTLARIGAPIEDIARYIDIYAKAVNRVRETPLDLATREVFKDAASTFERALSRYLLRRDKREDAHVHAFEQYTRQSPHAYRRIEEIRVETEALELPWRRAVCAAEALSLVIRRSEDSAANRLRLTVGNGHGIAGWLRQTKYDEPGDMDGDVKKASDSPGACESDAGADKRRQRGEWWTRVLSEAFRNGENPLYTHPAIRAAVDEIERVCDNDEKVLVFGRFTAPLRALTELLNARAMLKSLDAGRPWPQATLSDSEWIALQAAHDQLGRTGPLIRDEMVAKLETQYRIIENQRRAFRADLMNLLRAGMTELPKHVLAMRLFHAFERSIDVAQNSEETTSPLALVARTLQELLSASDTQLQPKAVAAAFIEFVEASVDRGETDDSEDTEADRSTMALWKRITADLSKQQGAFARLMIGDTTPGTRRVLQLAFNRERGFPKVLVAQSMVGREGLNLHKACKTVVLLHQEWNPGVVEQQIGRVDRLGSFWQKSLDKAIAENVAPDAVPRIVVRPVIFTGTYDEWNWRVLCDRWDDLRAQLHGVVISPRVASETGVPAEIVEEINRAAPNFAPDAMTRHDHA
jgi:superfamily II DNA or RNA helicase